MAKVKETQEFFDAVAKLDRKAVTDLHASTIALSDLVESSARSISRLLQLMERVETDPNLGGRVEELQQTCRAQVTATAALEVAVREVSKLENQLHRIVGELLPHAAAAGYKVNGAP